MSQQQSKSVLRQMLKSRLRELVPADRQHKSDAAAQRVLSLPEYRQAKTVMLFVSMAAEIDTTAIAQDAWRTGKQVVIPRAHLGDRSMETVRVADFETDMHKTPIGVLEPIGNQIIPPHQIDFILVPGLGFGLAGQRIGRGAGFYDRFLGNSALAASTCGYSFDEQIIDDIPMTEHDVRIQMLITDQRLVRF